MNSHRLEDHISKRETPPGRWWPAAVYGLNFVLWIITGVMFRAWDFLWLAALPLPALGLYLWHTRRSGA